MYFHFLNQESDQSMASVAKSAYNDSLYEFHSWIVRGTVTGAVNMLPHKSQFINLIVKSQPSTASATTSSSANVDDGANADLTTVDLNDLSNLRAFAGQQSLPIMRSLYDSCQDLYVGNSLLQLK